MEKTNRKKNVPACTPPHRHYEDPRTINSKQEGDTTVLAFPDAESVWQIICATVKAMNEIRLSEQQHLFQLYSKLRAVLRYSKLGRLPAFVYSFVVWLVVNVKIQKNRCVHNTDIF